MKIIYYTNEDIQDVDLIPGYLKAFGDTVKVVTHRIDEELVRECQADFIVSDRARFLIRPSVLNLLKGKVINLHPSYLPYNRGYNPQFWSIIEGTPSGVTVHYIDEGIDTGDIIAQKRVSLSEEDTLRTAYNKHRDTMIKVFKECWPAIRMGSGNRQAQVGAGTLHYKKDLAGFFAQLPLGWDTPVKEAVKLLSGQKVVRDTV